MVAFRKVTVDLRSGRPIPPIWWRLPTFFLICAWVMAASFIFGALFAIRDGQPRASAIMLTQGAVILAAAYWNQRHVKRQCIEFDQRVAAYERVISESH